MIPSLRLMFLSTVCSVIVLSGCEKNEDSSNNSTFRQSQIDQPPPHVGPAVDPTDLPDTSPEPIIVEDTFVHSQAALPAHHAARRLLPDHYNQLRFTIIDNATSEHFKISGTAGNISIEGTSPAVLITGLNKYLQDIAHVSIGWPGDSLSRLPEKLPAVPQEITSSALVEHRFALNDTDDGYSDAFMSWSDWERKIDLLALHGYNEIFIPVGTEEVYRQTFKKFGYTDSEISQWIPAPPYQPWWLLQNMHSAYSTMSVSTFEKRAALGRKIADRLRELGMVPVFPGYLGTVPPQFGTKNNIAASDLHELGEWVTFRRPTWLDPRSAKFKEVASTFYDEQKKLLGDSKIFKIDPFHEFGGQITLPVAQITRSIMDALKQAHPKAVWTLIGWQDKPRQDTIRELRSDEMLIVDGISDRRLTLNRDQDFLSKPYTYGTIHNYGGKTTIGASVGLWNRAFDDNQSRTNTALAGVSYLPEATGFDPAAFDMFSKLAWSGNNQKTTELFKSYAHYRYGAKDQNAAAAWQHLKNSAYGFETTDTTGLGTEAEPQDSLFTARPALDRRSAATWSPKAPRYDFAEFTLALEELLKVAPEIRTTSAYQYDLVNVARQALTNRARILLPKINAAYTSKNIERFDLLTNLWLSYMDDLDALLRSNKHFLLSTWLSGARAISSDPDEARSLTYAQCAIITSWTNTIAGWELSEYAARDYHGLTGTLQKDRWQRFFAAYRTALVNNQSPANIPWFPIDADSRTGWAATNCIDSPVVEPQGDTHALASAILEKLKKEPQ